MAGFGSGAGLWMAVFGLILGLKPLLMLGIIFFAVAVVVQVINLPVEFNASSRAKAQLVSLGIIDQEGLHYVNKVLGAAALTYVAATLQAVMTLVWLVLRANSRRN